MTKKLCVLLLAGAGLVGGCNTPSTVNTVEVGADRPHNAIITDPVLAQWASVDRVNKARADDLFRINVDVTNRTDSPHTIMYRFVWIDEEGQAVDTPMTTWRRAYIQPRQTQPLQGIAPDVRVKDARVELTRAD